MLRRVGSGVRDVLVLIVRSGGDSIGRGDSSKSRVAAE